MTLEHDRVVTFKTTRGDFIVPAIVLADEAALSAYLVEWLPPGCTSISRGRRDPLDGSVVVTWRKTRVVDIAP